MLSQQNDSINPSFRHQQSETLSHVFEPVEFPLPRKGGLSGPSNVNPRQDSSTTRYGVSGSTRFRADPLSLYLDQALKSSLLTQAEEIKLTKALFRHRKAFQRLILKESNVIAHFVDLLESVLSKRTRLDTVCNFGLSETAKRKQVEPLLRPTLNWLKKIYKKGQSLETAEGRKAHREAVKRIESLMIRPNHFESAPFENQKAAELLANYQGLCQTIVSSNLRLVVQVARQVCRNSQAILDVIQEGNRGLMHAVTKFDHHCGVRFSTYAIPWIKQAIFGALPNLKRNIRVPENFRSISRRVKKKLGELQRGSFEFRQTDSGTTIALIADSLDMEPSDVADHLRMQRDTCSLDQPFVNAIGCGSDSQVNNLGDLLPSQNPDPAEESMVSERQRLVRSMMNQALTRRERDVISMRFGFKDGKSCSFAAIGREMGLTRQRVCQVEKRAMSKLEKMSGWVEE